MILVRGWTFDHIGLVVKSLPKANAILSGTLGIADWTEPLRDAVNGVHLQFGRDAAGMVYELLQPIDSTSPVYSALSGGKAIINHVAYLVDDLASGAEHLCHLDSVATSDPKPAIAYGGARIQFFVTPLRFVIELIEAPRHTHVYGLTSDVANSMRGLI